MIHIIYIKVWQIYIYIFLVIPPDLAFQDLHHITSLITFPNLTMAAPEKYATHIFVLFASCRCDCCNATQESKKGEQLHRELQFFLPLCLFLFILFVCFVIYSRRLFLIFSRLFIILYLEETSIVFFLIIQLQGEKK